MELVKTYSKPRPLDYPAGSMLFDVRYSRRPSELYEVIYYNPITDRLEVSYEKPIVDIWFEKKEFRNHDQYQLPQVKLEDCYPVYCKPSQIPAVIAQEVGGEWLDLYMKIKDAWGVYDIKKKMCECPYVYKGDFQEDVYFRLRWLNEFGEDYDISKVESAYLDIEVDVLDRTIDAKDYTTAPQPINAVSLILPKQKICALFVLGPRNYNQIDEQFHELLEKQKKAFNWLNNHVDEFRHKIANYDVNNRKYIGDFTIRLHQFEYNDELSMISMIFAYINKYRPWFTLSWNAPFDDNYLVNRARWLGADPSDLVVPKDFKTRKIYFSEDKNKKATIKDSKDFFFASTYTQYLCQERLYAATRKSQQNLRSYSLDAIAKKTAGIRKLSDTKSDNFRKFAYTDTINFLLYNVRDTVAQYAIELNCADTGSFASRSYTFCTAYSKCFQEIHIVRNTREYFFEKEGYVQACRLLVDPSWDTAYEGAFVADPHLNYPTGMIVNGKRVNNIIIGALDADAASYYPSTKMGENQDPMSLEYKCIIDNEELFLSGKCTNKSYNQEYYWYDNDGNRHVKDMTGPIINTYKNGNIASLAWNWLNAPSISDIFEYVDANL